MENFKIITIILSSSLLSSGLTGFISWIVKQNDYKKEIQKNFIEKRLNAYQDIELMLRAMYWVIGDSINGKKYHLFLMDSEQYTSFMLGFGRALHATMWYSNEIRTLLLKLNHFILENSEFMPLNPDQRFINEEFVTELRVKIAISLYKEIDDFKKELENQMIKDFSRFHKIHFSEFKR
jgi:hypothetical protein